MAPVYLGLPGVGRTREDRVILHDFAVHPGSPTWKWEAFLFLKDRKGTWFPPLGYVPITP